MVCQENHYYPFGLNMVGIEYYGEPGTPYQYNGKEKEEIFDLGWYDFGARWYSPQIGRWFNTDPAEQVASPYDFCGGDPIANVDPDGRSFARWFAQNEEGVVGTGIMAAAIAISVATAGSATPAATLLINSMIIGASAGAVGGAVNAYFAGGSGAQIAGSALVGAAVGAATAYGCSFIPPSLISTTAGQIVIGAFTGAASGAVNGGLTSLVMGRSFSEGAIAGAGGGMVGSLMGLGIGKLIRLASPLHLQPPLDGLTANLEGGGGVITTPPVYITAKGIPGGRIAFYNSAYGGLSGSYYGLSRSRGYAGYESRAYDLGYVGNVLGAGGTAYAGLENAVANKY